MCVLTEVKGEAEKAAAAHARAEQAHADREKALQEADETKKKAQARCHGGGSYTCI